MINLRVGWVSSGTEVGYRRLFYFTRSDKLLENLLNKEIKISEFAKCNDFFELASVKLTSNEVKKQHREWSANIGTKMGLICFSKSWRHPLMWAHYAGNGSGVCLVVDVHEKYLQDIEYVSERTEPTNRVRFPDISASGFRGFCSTKARFWSYEEEVRFFANFSDREIKSRDGLKFLPFGDAVKLVGIINGPRPSLGKSIICRAAEKVRFFQCRPAFTKFEMVSSQLEKNWKP